MFLVKKQQNLYQGELLNKEPSLEWNQNVPKQCPQENKLVKNKLGQLKKLVQLIHSLIDYYSYEQGITIDWWTNVINNDYNL